MEPLRIDLVAQDIVAFQRWLRHQFSGPLASLLGVVLLLALLGAMTTALSTGIGAVCVFVAAASWFPFWFSARRRRRRAARWNAEYAAVLSGVLTVDATGYRYETPNARTSSMWSALVGIEETEGYIFLMTSSRSALIVPKRCFADAAAASAFAAFCEGNVGQLQALDPR